MVHDDQMLIEQARRMLEAYGWTVKTTDCCEDQIVITVVLKKEVKDK